MPFPWIMSRDDYSAWQAGVNDPADPDHYADGPYETIITPYPLATAAAIAEANVRGVACSEYKATQFARETDVRRIGRGFAWEASDIDRLINHLADHDALTSAARLRKRSYYRSKGIPASSM